jgi:peptidoglycan/LPS O-acetylase OafA/YrhL
MGVDLFLTLSAYLITKLLWLEWQRTGSLSVLGFYIRRALRIWPLYFLACLLGFFLLPFLHLDVPFTGTPAYGEMLKGYLLSYLGFFANLATARHGYIESLSLGPLWTISMEEQFYFLWPLLLVLLRFDRKKILGTGLLLLAFSALGRYYCLSQGIPHPALWVSLPTRLDPFVFGTLLAFYEKDLRSWTRRIPAWAFLATGLFCLGLAMALPEMETQRPEVIWQFTLLDLGWALVLFAVGGAGRLGTFLARKPFLRLGKISYGLYVYHLLALHLAGLAVFWLQGLFPQPLPSLLAGWAVSALGLMLTLALASLSYDVYEKPFLEWKKRFTKVASRPV